MGDDLYDTSFSRNIGILTHADQQRLARSTVAIAGLGGIGGNTLILLARLGVGRFRVADFDRFDWANINRQYGARADTIGQSKCDVLADEVQRINPSARIEVFSEGFTDDNGDDFLTGADVAIDAIDFYAIETHLQFHRRTRAHGLYTVMGSPVGFSACLQVFDPGGMGLEEYCDIRPGMRTLEKQLRYACGVVPGLAHIDYFDVSAGSANTDFLSRRGPSLACACAMAAALVTAETVILLLKRRKPRVIPHTFQFDPYTFRYEQSYVEGGMAHFDPDVVMARIPDKSSLVPRVLDLFYKRAAVQKAAVRGVELSYKVQGSGANLLLISPLGADASFWVRQYPALSGQFRVIGWDSRGSGVSSPCPREWSTAEMAEDAIALLDSLGVEKTHVVGLALGGLVAQHLVLKRPDLVDRLVLASCYCKADDHLRDLILHWSSTATEYGMESLFEQCIEWLFSPEYLAAGHNDLDNLRAFYRLTLQAPECFCRQSLAGLLHDSSAYLDRIRCPTLVLHGGRDRLVPLRMAQPLVKDLPRGNLVVLESSPHFMTWEHDDRFNQEVLKFLGGPGARC
jgi:pimeloyl-ACP methyl ester carboxylesterase/molybdopterin/thiamine biosynthesis adenylyltransferase